MSEINATLYTGDCVEVLKELPAGSVDSVVTSPPYAMQRATTYGGIYERDYPEWTVKWMAEVWRVLKDEGSVIINISPHVKNGELSDYVLRTRLALREAGWKETGELIWHKNNAPPFGHKRRPRRAWESLHWFSKSKDPYCDPKANGNPTNTSFKGRNLAGQGRREGWNHYVQVPGKLSPKVARSTDVVTLGTSSESTGHPATYPWQLAEWCGKLITPPGGTILDPFTGSSSTGVAAKRNGWDFIGIDQSPEYIEMSRQRLKAMETTKE